MTVAHIYTVAFQGVEAREVDVQVHVGDSGGGQFNIVGLADKAVAESSERVTFVVGQNRRIVAVLSSRADISQKINQLIEKSAPAGHPAAAGEALTPDQHVTKSLEIVRHLRPGAR